VTESERPPSAAGKAASLLLALLPPARMAWIVFTNGENNLSNDYINRAPLVSSMLDGTCTLVQYLKGAWIAGGHSTLALMPIYYLNARFFAWDVRVELALGLLLAGATLALIAAALPARPRWLLLPLLSLLLFSTTKVTSLTFGESTLQMGLAQLGVATGAFAVARRSDRPLALSAWLGAGGILASWSWGGGIMAWPVFFAVLAVLRTRRLAAWSILAATAALGVAQYVWLLLIQPVVWKEASTLQLSTFLRVFLELLGRPLSNNVAINLGRMRSAQIIGALGALILLATLLMFARDFRRGLPQAVLLAWSLLVALQIALFRDGVSPWYLSPMMIFWCGLLGLAMKVSRPLGMFSVAITFLLALRTQATWEDKSFYLPSRSPLSAACLRAARKAPPICEEAVFQWRPVGRGTVALLAQPLERLSLSVFGSRKTYLLQGDVLLGRVRLDPASAPSFFSRDGKNQGNIEDFHRLDLVLSPGAIVTWRVDVPPGTRTARFRTVVRTDPDESFNARGAAVSAAAGPDGPTTASRVFFPRGEKRELVLDLSRFAGRTVNLLLAAEETQPPGAPLLLEAPRIELALERTK
jgi:hypothetical protein